jgi:hypothetical protein
VVSELEIEIGSDDTFTERVDLQPTRTNEHVGTAEISVKAGSTEQELITRLIAENLTLKARVVELESQLNDR